MSVATAGPELAPAPIAHDSVSLFEENKRLAYWTANKHFRRQPGYDLADLQQAALLALWVAAQRYDPARGPFAAYAGRVVEGQVLRHLRERRSRPLLQVPIAGPDDGPGMLDQVEARKEIDLDERQETIRQVRELGETELPEREWRILKRRFGLDGGRPTHSEPIAAELGVSPQRVRQLVARGLAMLRVWCEDRGLDPGVLREGAAFVASP